MIAAALNAEIFRFRRNRTAWFWGMTFLPLAMVLFGLALDLVAVNRMGVSGRILPIDHATRILSIGGNPIAHLFYGLAAAAVFADDYRYESWRLIAYRAARPSLILAKAATFILFAAASLLLASLGSFLASIIVNIAQGIPFTPPSGDAVGAWSATLAASLCELAAWGAMIALLAIATRSLIASVLPIFFLSLVQSLLLAYVNVAPTSGWPLLLPAFAGDAARAWAHGLAGTPALFDPVVPGRAAGLAFASLLFWSVACTAAACLLFSRQDLSRE